MPTGSSAVTPRSRSTRARREARSSSVRYVTVPFEVSSAGALGCARATSTNSAEIESPRRGATGERPSMISAAKARMSRIATATCSSCERKLSTHSRIQTRPPRVVGKETRATVVHPPQQFACFCIEVARRIGLVAEAEDDRGQLGFVDQLEPGNLLQPRAACRASWSFSSRFAANASTRRAGWAPDAHAAHLARELGAHVAEVDLVVLHRRR
jgi:hypothetical protein